MGHCSEDTRVAIRVKKTVAPKGAPPSARVVFRRLRLSFPSFLLLLLLPLFYCYAYNTIINNNNKFFVYLLMNHHSAGIAGVCVLAGAPALRLRLGSEQWKAPLTYLLVY